MTSYCKRCGAEIEWKEINTRDGPKMHPFNAGGTNVSHFKNCPYADEFRSPKVNASYKPVELQDGLEKWM